MQEEAVVQIEAITLGRNWWIVTKLGLVMQLISVACATQQLTIHSRGALGKPRAVKHSSAYEALTDLTKRHTCCGAIATLSACVAAPQSEVPSNTCAWRPHADQQQLTVARHVGTDRGINEATSHTKTCSQPWDPCFTQYRGSSGRRSALSGAVCVDLGNTHDLGEVSALQPTSRPLHTGRGGPAPGGVQLQHRRVDPGDTADAQQRQLPRQAGAVGARPGVTRPITQPATSGGCHSPGQVGLHPAARRAAKAAPLVPMRAVQQRLRDNSRGCAANPVGTRKCSW